MKPTLEELVQQAIDDELAEQMGIDPDGVTVLSVEDGIASIRLQPGCLG